MQCLFRLSKCSHTKIWLSSWEKCIKLIRLKSSWKLILDWVIIMRLLNEYSKLGHGGE